jgi:hypothetical protein
LLAEEHNRGAGSRGQRKDLWKIAIQSDHDTRFACRKFQNLKIGRFAHADFADVDGIAALDRAGCASCGIEMQIDGAVHGRRRERKGLLKILLEIRKVLKQFLAVWVCSQNF